MANESDDDGYCENNDDDHGPTDDNDCYDNNDNDEEDNEAILTYSHLGSFSVFILQRSRVIEKAVMSRQVSDLT